MFIVFEGIDGSGKTTVSNQVAAALVARFALRRVRISPLGVSRQVTPKPPTAWRLVVLALGVAELFYFIGNRPESGLGQAAAYLPGLLLIMAGLVRFAWRDA